VPYSCQPGYAHRAQVIYDLAAYSRWCGDDAFAKAEQRLGQGLRIQSSAA
jgi:hypothetical protein